MRKTIAIVFCGAVAATGAGVRPASADSPAHSSEAGKILRCPAHVPAALDPPSGMTLTAGMAASGTQGYVCTAPVAGGTPAWVLIGPLAVLSEGKETAATHFSGPAPAPPIAAKAPVADAPAATPASSTSPTTAPSTAPTWRALDGSRITGARVASAPAPDGKSIPWLLLRSTSSPGPGRFGDVTWVQRLDTVGGAAPATGCDAAHLGAEKLVPYRASYFFYHPIAAGAPLRRCASK